MLKIIFYNCIKNINIADVPNIIAKSIRANLLSFFMIAIIRATIPTIILIQAKRILENSPAISIVSNRYNPVITNNIVCITFANLLFVLIILSKILHYLLIIQKLYKIYFLNYTIEIRIFQYILLKQDKKTIVLINLYLKL